MINQIQQQYTPSCLAALLTERAKMNDRKATLVFLGYERVPMDKEKYI